MRFSVSISASAERDLREIADYVAQDRSLDSAIQLVESITSKIFSLEKFPHRGSVPDEVRMVGQRDFRQMLVGPYRIFYAMVGQTVSITMIADGRRDIISLLRHRLTQS